MVENPQGTDLSFGVLVVDDQAAIRTAIAAILDRDQRLVEAASGEEAISLAQSEEFALIFLDVSLPGLSGFQTAEQLRANPRTANTPIIFFTAGNLDPGLLERGYSLGAVDFLTKPLTPVAVQAKVKTLVGLFRSKQQAKREAEQLRLLIQGTLDYALFMLDPQGYVKTWNTGAERLKGYTSDEVVGQHFSIFYPPELIQRKWPEHELTVAKASGRFEDEGWRLRKNGSRFWANVIITALRDEYGTLLGFSKVTRDLTERKKSEENALRLAEETAARRVVEESAQLLSEQRERLHVTLASIGDAVMVTDTEGRIVSMNPVAESLTGWTSATAAGVPLEEVFRIVNESTRQVVESPATRALREGVIVGLANHTLLISRDGLERPIDDSAAPIRSKGGQIIGCVLVFRDVTERRAAEKALSDSELRYRLIGLAANDAIWDWDLNTNQVIWNEGAFRAFGHAPQEIGGTADWWVENIHPDDRERITAGIHSAIEGGAEFWRNEYRFRRAEGTYAEVVDRGHIVRQDGVPVRMVGSMLDLTERNRSREALEVSEDRFNFVRQSSGVGFWYCDLPFDVLQWDEQVKTHFHLPADAHVTIGTFYDRILPSDREATRTAIEKSIHERRPYDVVYRTADPATGAEKWIRAIARTTYDPNGNPIRFDGVTIDVSQQKHVEAQLREVAAALSEAGHRKDEFLATLAHELRNPLAPIRNALQLMRLSSDPQLQEGALGIMDRQLSQMVRLVDDLMDVSRITRGKVALQKASVSLAMVINSAVETSRPLLESMDHVLEMSLPAEPLIVDADVTRLAQVFANLLNNAAKYSDRGGRITLTVSQGDGEAKVVVRDEGIGIAPGQLPHVFDMFMQVDHTLERSQGGLGIGLTLVKRLTEMHGGRVEAKSEGVGRGAEFTVRLPIVGAPVSAKGDVEPKALRVRSSRRILVVDDNEDGANSLALMLGLLGNETRAAHDGEEGIRLAQEYCPDVILLDIGMPKLNGLEAARFIRQQAWGKSVVLIALTGWGQEEDRQRSQKAGFDHHFVKPVDPRSLLQLLDSKSDGST